MTIQIISKDNRVVCRTTVPYPPHIIREMKKGGYKVREIIEPNDSLKEKESENE